MEARKTMLAVVIASTVAACGSETMTRAPVKCTHLMVPS